MKKFGAWIAPFLVAAFVFTPAKAYVGASHELMKLSADELSSKHSENLFDEVIASCALSRTKEDCRKTGLMDLCKWNDETEACRIDLMTFSQKHRHVLGMIANAAAIVLGAEVFFTSFHVQDLVMAAAMAGGGLLLTGHGVSSVWDQWGVSNVIDRVLKREELALRRAKLLEPNKHANNEHVLVIEEIPTDAGEQEKSLNIIEMMMQGFERTQNPKSLLWVQARDRLSLKLKLGRIPTDANITHIVIRSKELPGLALEPLRKHLDGRKAKVFLDIDEPAWNAAKKNYEFANQKTLLVKSLIGESAIVYVPDSACFCTGFTRTLASLFTFAFGAAASTLFTERLELFFGAGLGSAAFFWDLLPQCSYAIDGDKYSEFIGDYVLMVPPHHWFSGDMPHRT